MSSRSCSVYILTLVLVSASGSFAQTNTEVELRVNQIVDSSAPEVFGRYVIFTFAPSLPVRHVGVSFAHEEYRRIVNLAVNESGVYLLLYRPPEGIDKIDYKYVVDGLWMLDPKNEEAVFNSNGDRVSRLEARGVFPVTPASPVMYEGGRVELFYHGVHGQRVYVTGDFTNWDPFLLRMEEVEPGVYRVLLTLPAGVYHYQYVVNGTLISDPLNPATVSRNESPSSLLLVN